ncbi:MAG: hypothetical protein BVN28_08200 [Nitrospira sp. ST-bin4]|jgi:hypothetical protein|nr:MAG: hypothetical protein BVN28_08200 [Nitrospira sp. ST-bin4]
MYGLKPNVDLRFFVGKELIQVAVGPADVQFHFHERVSLSVQSRIEHISEGVETEWDGDENKPLAAASLLGLISSSVTSVQGDSDGTLSLRFTNGDLLKVFDDSEHYESYQINPGDGKNIIV